uniref:Uncharacterized protein n=1 Tax=Mycena chlorophos TaxID=658473 RepID=A0ABQ0KVN7_MYCCL|nr:predicted protein [Mycena chlorophos]
MASRSPVLYTCKTNASAALPIHETATSRNPCLKEFDHVAVLRSRQISSVWGAQVTIRLGPNLLKMVFNFQRQFPPSRMDIAVPLRTHAGKARQDIRISRWADGKGRGGFQREEFKRRHGRWL